MLSTRRKFITGLACVMVSFGSSAFADKKGNDKNGNGKKTPKGQKQRQQNGATKSIPPGQIKRYTRGQKLPTDLKWDDITDLGKWKLPAAGKGNKYIRVSDEIYEIAEDTNTVVNAIGIASDWLK
ncbi:MAG: hypothetical protein ABJO27_10550 [Pseudoruegeria sp.]